MAQVLVTESYLEDIADAIREKNGSEDTYTPGQMAGAIEDIHTADEVVLVNKSVTENGTYNPASDSADGYSGVTVNVPNTYTASDNGKVVVDQALTAQTSKSINANGTHDTTANNSVVVDVPNSYAAADEGKVVSQGSLVTQTIKNITENGTHDTTTNNEVIVNVSATPVLYKFFDPDYVMDETGIICTLNGREFTKIYSDPALVAYYYNGAYTGPILLSKTENGAKYSAFGGTSTSSIITIDGEQWYVSSNLYPMSGDLSKTAGFAQKLSGTYSTVDAVAEALYSIAQTALNANGSYNIPSGYDGFNDFVVDVPNTYTQSDEGKVVSNGSLVSQGSRTITENGTYDTTLISELIVNISGGGNVNILSGSDEPTANQGNNGDIFLQFDNINVPNDYTLVEYIQSDSSGNAYINTNYKPNGKTKAEAVIQNAEKAARFFGMWNSAYNRGAFCFANDSNQGLFVAYANNGGSNGSYTDQGKHKVVLDKGIATIDDNVVRQYSQDASFQGNYNLFLFSQNQAGTAGGGSSYRSVQMYYCKIYDDNDLVRYYVPVIRKQDSVVGMYDLVNNEFYNSAGSGTFVAGNQSENNPITSAYLKVNGAWQNLIGSSIVDVNT